MKRRFLLPPSCVATIILLTACSRGAELLRVHETRTPMGTYMAITVYAPSEAVGRRAMAAAFARVEEVEAATSTYRPKSDISRLNGAAGGTAVTVSPDLWRPVRRALLLAKETAGAFDPTVGPLVELWKTTWHKGKLPSPEALQAARDLVNYRLVECSDEKPLLRLTKPGMRLVLSGIAKGYAVDQAIVVLRGRGIPAALVDAGGDMCAYGVPPRRKTWLVGIRDPQNRGSILPNPVRLLNGAVATSGDYEQFGVIDGKRYSHILDPRTGRPVQGMTSVTVVAPDAMTADALATAASVLGPQDAMALSEKRPDIEMMILNEQDGKLRTIRSTGFRRLEVTDTDGP